MTSIYLVRHGDYLSGPTDSTGVAVDLGLSELGQRQAAALRDRIRAAGGIAADALYASTMPRALQTAQAIATALGQEVVAEPDFEEWRSGNDAIGPGPFAALWSALDPSERQDHRFLATCETAMEFNERVLRALLRIVHRHRGQRVVVVAHGGIIEAAFCHFLGLGDGPFRSAYQAVGHTSITHWRCDHETDEWVLETANDMHHVHGLPQALTSSGSSPASHAARTAGHTTAPGPVSALPELLGSMHPVMNDGVYVFASVPLNFDVSSLVPVATIREREGITVVVEEARAEGAGLTVVFRAAWIVLNVHSDLQAVGLTAAFSSALAQANIACNVVAGAFHDHVFVPFEAAGRALATLRDLQARYGSSTAAEASS